MECTSSQVTVSGLGIVGVADIEGIISKDILEDQDRDLILSEHEQFIVVWAGDIISETTSGIDFQVVTS